MERKLMENGESIQLKFMTIIYDYYIWPIIFLKISSSIIFGTNRNENILLLYDKKQVIK